MAVNYYVSVQVISTTASTIVSWGVIISAFSVILGAIITIRFHLGRIQKKRGDWLWSIWLIISIIVVYTIGITFTATSYIYQWIIINVLSGLSETVYSLVGLFAITAAYRSFRIRNTDAGILFAVATIVIIGQNIPIGEMISPVIPAFAKWILDYPNVAANTAVVMAELVVATAYSIRLLIGRERGA
jgi:hypothetical protein